mmetsp:Transcript_56330/g.134439  ORF Transcript_56330/g.134439 Transcript_56330/m.134439 type:complete len:243 (-) Transcript_56330:4015-4743(-)
MGMGMNSFCSLRSACASSSTVIRASSQISCAGLSACSSSWFIFVLMYSMVLRFWGSSMMPSVSWESSKATRTNFSREPSSSTSPTSLVICEAISMCAFLKIVTKRSRSSLCSPSSSEFSSLDTSSSRTFSLSTGTIFPLSSKRSRCRRMPIFDQNSASSFCRLRSSSARLPPLLGLKMFRCSFMSRKKPLMENSSASRRVSFQRKMIAETNKFKIRRKATWKNTMTISKKSGENSYRSAVSK